MNTTRFLLASALLQASTALAGPDATAADGRWASKAPAARGLTAKR